MNTSLRYGLIGGVLIAILLFAPFFIFGARPEWMKIGEIVGYTSMFLCMSTTYFAMREEARWRGALSFSAALAIGAGVSVVAGMLFGFATWAFYALVGDSLPEALLAFYAEQIRSSGAAPAQIASQLQELEAMRPFFYNHVLQGALMAATVFLIGLLISVPSALLVSRAPRREPATA
jgi:hypothetical protein